MATVVSELGDQGWHPRKRLWLLLGAAIVGSVGFGAIASWRESHVLLINASDSLPNWAFLIRRHQLPVRGDYVFFDPPRSALLLRHFGSKPQMFGKIVYGMPGDLVAHNGALVMINGAPIGQMKPRTRAGEQLTPGAVGAIPAGCYYAGSPHRDGFDSRYADIGFVCGRQLIGVGEPVL
jgi:conjugal transfer pilin signal peptidase TrbI